MGVNSGCRDRASADPHSHGFSPVSPRWGWVRDLALGVVVFVGLWLTVSPADDVARFVQLSLGAAAIVGLVLSTRWPVVAVIVTAGVTAAAWLFGATADPFVLTGFAVFRLAEGRGVRRFPWWMFAGTLLVIIVSLAFGAEGIEDRFRGMLLSAVILSAAWALGVRTREVKREAAARARAEERLRLARDVHDVLSHSLGAIGVQAGVAAHVTTLGTDELRAVLREIEGDARSSLTELKLLLQRERTGADASSSLPLMAALAEVIQTAEQSGLTANLRADGEIDVLPIAVRTTVLRVVQEAVTNVIRHAGASELAVVLQVSADSLTIQVTDNGHGALNGVREGHGVTGMRERIRLIGGTANFGSSNIGFIVSAVLPLAARTVEGGIG